jgi:hypothetical protein
MMFHAKRALRAGEFVTTDDVLLCEMVVDWHCDEHGERGEEITCGKPGAYVWRTSTSDLSSGPLDAICADCYATLDEDERADYRPLEMPKSWWRELVAGLTWWWRKRQHHRAFIGGRCICDACSELAPRLPWDHLRDLGWRSTTWCNPPSNHAVFCPDCWATRGDS